MLILEVAITKPWNDKKRNLGHSKSMLQNIIEIKKVPDSH